MPKKYCLFKRCSMSGNTYCTAERKWLFWSFIFMLWIRIKDFTIFLQRFNKSFWQIAKLILRAHFGWGLGETWAQTISSWSSCEIYKLVLGSIGLIYLECFIADAVLEQIAWIAVAYLYIGKIVGRIFCSELLQENKNSFLQELKCELGNSFLSLLNGKLLLSHPKPLSTPKDS